MNKSSIRLIQKIRKRNNITKREKEAHRPSMHNNGGYWLSFRRGEIYRTLQSLRVSISHAYAFGLGNQGYPYNIDLVLAFPLKVNKSRVDLLIKIDQFVLYRMLLSIFKLLWKTFFQCWPWKQKYISHIKLMIVS